MAPADRPRRRLPLTLLLVLLAAVVLHHGAVFVGQRFLLFPGASMGLRQGRLPDGAERLDAGGSWGWFVPAAADAPRPAPLVVYAHGNAESATDLFLWYDEPYTASGCHLLAIEYRGFAGVPGSPSEEALVADTVALVDAACRRPDVDPTRVVYHGRSLGGAVLGTVAGVRPPARLILEAAFSSVPSMARRLLVPAYLLRDRFDVPAALARYDGPVLLLHSTADEVVPYAESRRILAAAGAARVTDVSSDTMGHNDSWIARDPALLVSFTTRWPTANH